MTKERKMATLQLSENPLVFPHLTSFRPVDLTNPSIPLSVTHRPYATPKTLLGLVWFIEGSLSVITIHTLELLDGKGIAAFSLLMSCNALNHGPGLAHLRDLEHSLAGR